jgi:class 3 adenylate cyclase
VVLARGGARAGRQAAQEGDGAALRLAGSTALGETLDPERLCALLARYFERMRAIVGRHGGSVERFIGDAVMAVFGVSVLHEDDALRAVRAAVEMRDALPELGLQGRMTGEVVTRTESVSQRAMP